MSWAACSRSFSVFGGGGGASALCFWRSRRFLTSSSSVDTLMPSFFASAWRTRSYCSGVSRESRTSAISSGSRTGPTSASSSALAWASASAAIDSRTASRP